MNVVKNENMKLMEESMKIRRATEADRNDIAYVYANAFSEDWKQLSSDTEKVKRALRNGLILNNYIVAICDEKIVAFIALVTDKMRAFKIPMKDFQKEFGFFKGYMVGMAMKNDMEKEILLDKNTVYIDIIGVCKKYQHRGIASSLIDYVVENFDYSYYLLSVTDINSRAIECYKKKGFVEVKREKVKYPKQRGFSEYLYMKKFKKNN